MRDTTSLHTVAEATGIEPVHVLPLLSLAKRTVTSPAHFLGTPGKIRTYTVQILSLLSLPVGIQGLGGSYRNRTYLVSVKSRVHNQSVKNPWYPL